MLIKKIVDRLRETDPISDAPGSLLKIVRFVSEGVSDVVEKFEIPGTHG
jgi:hypothetical protein